MRKSNSINSLSEGVVAGTGYGKTFIDSYHRTGDVQDTQAALDKVKSILQNGFKPGTGALYGVGLYSTGDWLSQFGGRGNGYMLGYGSAIIKFRTPAKGVLLFDYRIARKVYGNNYTLEDQLINFGVISYGKVPKFISLLSEDLMETFKNPRVSADRALVIWKNLWCDHKAYIATIQNLNASPDTIQQYLQIPTAEIPRDLYHNPKIIGIAFSGSNDGNVLFIKKEQLSKAKPLAYCVMDSQKSSDPRAFIVPWTLVGSISSVAGTAIVLKDALAAAGVPRGKNTFDETYVQCSAKDGVTVASTFVKSNFPWASNAMNSFQSLDVAFDNSKKDYIFGGVWMRGKCTAHYFGEPGAIKQELSICGRTSSNFDMIPTFKMGEFEGGEFRGKMLGGVFNKGAFNGIFIGGVLNFDGNISWGPAAKCQNEGSFSKSIKYKGVVYKIGDQNPLDYYNTLVAGEQSNGNAADLTVSLSDAIKAKLPFKVDNLDIPDNWQLCKTIPDGVRLFKKVFSWLFNRSRIIWSTDTPVSIQVRSTMIEVISGTLRLGDVYFDKWAKGTEVKGGNIYSPQGSKNIFFGTLSGGNYREGIFNGEFKGGILYLDKLIWEPSAKFIWDENSKIAFVYKGKQTKIDNKMLYYNGGKGSPKYNHIQKLIPAVKSGEYLRDVIAVSKASLLYKQGKGPHPSLLFAPKIAKSLVAISQADIDTSLAADDWSDDDGFTEKRAITEKQFFTRQLSDSEQDKLYQVFYDTYVKVVGASFNRDEFDWRAAGWEFYGNPPDDNNPNAPCGGVSVRRQASNNMYKMTSSFGDFRSVLKGFDEFSTLHKNDPCWSILTPEIAKMMQKHSKDWKTLPALVVKTMEGMLKKLTNGDVLSAGLNGVLKVSTPAGVMNKVFIANRAYITWLLESIENPEKASRIPIPQVVLKPLVGLLKVLI